MEGSAAATTDVVRSQNLMKNINIKYKNEIHLVLPQLQTPLPHGMHERPIRRFLISVKTPSGAEQRAEMGGPAPPLM